MWLFLTFARHKYTKRMVNTRIDIFHIVILWLLLMASKHWDIKNINTITQNVPQNVSGVVVKAGGMTFSGNFPIDPSLDT